MDKLGIVAGGGALPGMLIEACQAEGRPFFVLGLKGHADPQLLPPGVPVRWVRLGAVGESFRASKKAGVKDVILIGSVRRPSFAELCPDWTGFKFLAKAGLRALGDDGLLRAVVKEIEREGFRVVGIDSVLPALKAKAGVYGRVKPTQKDRGDIARGLQAAKLVGQADVGQGVVVQQGLVLAVEAIEGTDAMIARAGTLKRKGGGGVFVKCAKPQQERRVDLPTIGVHTVRNVADAGLKGIAVEAGRALVVDADATVKAADKAGIFLVGV